MPSRASTKENSPAPLGEDAFIRRANIEDLPDVAKLHRLAFTRALPHLPILHTPAEDLNFYTTGVFTSAEIWVAEWSQMVAGFIAFRAGWVDHLYIHPDLQRRGLGSRLLAQARQSGGTLRLWTFQANPGARAFYEKHGFRSERETDGSRNEEHQPDILYVWERELG